MRNHDTLLTGCTALLLLALGLNRSLACAAEEITDLGPLFEVLHQGTSEERLDEAVDCDVLAEAALTETADPAAVVDGLLAFLDAEPDPWIRFTCLYNLVAFAQDSHLAPLFATLLADGRPADLWPAVAWLAEHREPDALPHLQDLWPARKRPWLQSDLIRALGLHGSTDHLQEFIELAHDRDPQRFDLAVAAVEALGLLGDEAAVPELISLSHGKGTVAHDSITALARWPESDLARGHLLQLLDRADGRSRFVALEALGAFDHPDVLAARLLLVEDASAPDDLKNLAIRGLAGEDDPAVFPVLRAMATGDIPGEEYLRKAAWEVLELNAEVGTDEALIHFMGLPRAPVPNVFSFTLSCGGIVSLSDDNPPILRVTPWSGRSLRCWQGPGRIVPWEDDEPTERIPAGFPVPFDAVYEGPDGTLVQNHFGECWLPLDQLAYRRADEDETDLDFFWEDPLNADFDIPLQEADTTTALRLQDAGLLELFDPGPGTIGAALVLDEYRPDQQDLLLHLSEAGDAPLLQAALKAALEELTPADDIDP